MRSDRNRWPCVDIAMRSTFSSFDTRMISSDGSPMASCVRTVRPCAEKLARRVSRYARSSFISSDSRRLSRSKLRAAQPSATWTRSSSAPVIFASPATCVRIVLSAGECSTATRMRLYMSTRQSLPHRTEQDRKNVDVEDGDDDGDGPRQRLHPERARERSHLVRVAREDHERDDRERQLQAEDDLAQDQQLSGPSFA